MSFQPDPQQRLHTAFESAWKFEGAAHATLEEIIVWGARKLLHLGSLLRDEPAALPWLREQPHSPFLDLLLAAVDDCPPSYLERQLGSLLSPDALEVMPRLMLWLGLTGRNLLDAVRLPSSKSGNGPTGSPRLVFDLETLTVTLDGTRHGPLAPIAFQLLKALHEAPGVALSSAHLQTSIPGCKGDEKTLRKHIAGLPRALRDCIKAQPGIGRWLLLPSYT